ncbi:methyltransferase domain-containing protein [Aporhodopirellula rubra]|uniref:methyltransferase domain-containing protein n=1 Tax=Aporhodopirellula rubra TaxID=980271 RepID=UPI0036F21F68
MFLKVIPDGIIQKDYGCGDPTPSVRLGDSVLDLGSGGGKLCYLAAQVVGRDGQVSGIDCNQECSISLASMLPRWPSNSAMPSWSFVAG